MRQSFDTLRRVARPVGLVLALGVAACTSSSRSSADGATCTSPPAVSRPIGYPKATQHDRRTWGSIVVHVDEQLKAYSEYRFGFTDPSGVEHLSKWASSAALAQHPDQQQVAAFQHSFRVLYKIGREATELTIYGMGEDGHPECYTPPKVWFGTNGNQGETGPVVIQPPSQPAVNVYRPDWTSGQSDNGNLAPVRPYITSTTDALSAG